MSDFIEIALPLTYKTRNRLVCGVGVNDAWYKTERKLESGERVKCPFSVKWKGMLNSATKKSNKFSKDILEYLTLEWLTFSNFRSWMEKQDWEGKEFSLISGDYYSPETCAFVNSTKDNLVYGIGVYEKGKYKGYDCSCGTKNGMTKEYSLWTGMLQRCYSDYQKQGRNATYVDCTVSDNFKDFQFFAEWCNNQTGFGIEGWCLDKDILVKGNKIYSEDTCVFVPSEINTLFNKKKKQRGLFPIGVSFHKRDKHYTATVSVGKGKSKSIGQFTDPKDAFLAYKTEKEKIVKEVAGRWSNQIDSRAYKALLSYEVEITD